ncbi:MAG: DUF2721 domain-containing protein [Proteobacteria bacterium]|nr:DUF2721 domain-containing protein [Pseudomonadota bacterium]MBU1739627.1 DUF2721 domain-containing protein [Pseudomonadota bacterium]
MDITLTTPALLFPAISLLLVAYTNRFNTLGGRIRTLHSQYRVHPDQIIAGQISSLRRRVILIRNMQAFGVASLFACVLCLFVLFAGKILAGKIIFACSLVLMMLSLLISFREILLSVQALDLELQDMQKD